MIQDNTSDCAFLSKRDKNYPKCRVSTPDEREKLHLPDIKHLEVSHSLPLFTKIPALQKANSIPNERCQFSGGSQLDNKHKKAMTAKPKIQPKPNLSYLKVQNSSISERGYNASHSETLDSNNTEQKQVDLLSSQLYEIPEDLSDMRSEPRIVASSSYVDIIGTKNSYELENYSDFVQYSSTENDTNDRITQGEYTQETRTPREPMYLEIEDSQIAKCISPIQGLDNQMVRSRSMEVIRESASKDSLSELLYEPVQSILDENFNSKNFSVPANVDTTLGSTNLKQYYFEMASNKVSEKKILTPSKKQVKQKKREKKKEKELKDKFKQNQIPQKKGAIFEDFSNDSELAKLGAKIREQLENQKN